MAKKNDQGGTEPEKREEIQQLYQEKTEKFGGT